ncbi:hypothetical protein F5B22DRAFT_256519 [Xylaria bambusicola]|uniref:uncharacterized protein n=1 Tax=Xylaria bambusicola TaxID=326684 RepID=UPI00200861AF|nr:uncharacterized protein F5B22DRAFT_256519 [Xylaria bambusicola]KAI0525854.1 hypothetical protein F5B22DRAFT_256519 [Xylaria bambusicola]
MDPTPSDVTSLVSRVRLTPWRRACVACSRAKRQCTKQVPRCRRCVEKGLHCAYLPPRRPELSPTTAGAEWPPLHSDDTALRLDGSLLAASDVPNPLTMPGGSAFEFIQMAEADLEGLELPTDFGPSRRSQPIIPSDNGQVSLRDVWFLAPETWIAEFTEPPPTTLRETEKSLKQYIESVQSWMRQWVTEGHSPLHHRELYSFHMPRHTQDAYTAMATYMGKTQGNQATVRQILEDRVSQLLQDQVVAASLGTEASNGSGLSIFAHVSRVQSLLCYQLIRLYDGDIRMRGQAETLIPTMYLWNKQMLESAKGSLGRPELFLTSSPFEVDGSIDAAVGGCPLVSPKAVWRAWIMAESVRRTWQATTVVQEVYKFFKDGWSECPGRLQSTMRRALWDASTAYAWARELGADKNPLLVSMAKLEEVLPQITPAEVDDFNIACIGLYGMERMDRWLEEKGRFQPQLLSSPENMLYGF